MAEAYRASVGETTSGTILLTFTPPIEVTQALVDTALGIRADGTRDLSIVGLSEPPFLRTAGSNTYSLLTVPSYAERLVGDDRDDLL